jgi:Transglutaminase-like superfamily
MSQNQDPETRNERRARERREQKQGRSQPVPQRSSDDSRNSKPLIPWLILAFILGAATATILLKKHIKSDEPVQTSSSSDTQNLDAKDFSFVLSLTPEQVADYDMAELNLLCGTGLNGNEKVNLNQCRKALDDLTKMVKAETERNWQRFQRNPSEYQNSEAYYRMGMLITVIRQDFKAKYNPKLITDPSKRTENEVFYKDASNVFLQGLLTGDKMGTCASMPVLYVAIGRRLGYPVYLVSTKGHLFCRWEDDKERMNFEGTGDGVRIDPDEKYHKFPFTLTQQEIENSTYLKNLTRAQELAIFLDTRAACLVASQRNPEALIAQAQAVRLAQKDGLSGLIESMAFGETIPSHVFQLRQVANHQTAPKSPSAEVDEINRINIENATLRARLNSNLGLPNTPINPYFPQTPATGFSPTPNLPGNQPR